MKKTELEQNVKTFLTLGVRPKNGFVTAGEALEHYVPVLQNYGIPSERFMPYDGLPPEQNLACAVTSHFSGASPQLDFLCQARVTDNEILRTTPYGKYHIGADTEVIHYPQVQNPEVLKAALEDRRAGHWVRSIPVSYLIQSSQWNDPSARGNIDLDQHVLVEIRLPTGVVRMPLAIAILRADYPTLEESGNILLVKFSPQDEWAGHAVEIVGYDDTGFLIKNSWGTAWGTAGYGHVSFAYHRIFSTQALVIHSGWSKPPATNNAQVQYADYRLKVFFDPLRRNLSLSTFTESREDPLFSMVTYQVYAQGILGNWMRATQLPSFYSSALYPEYWSQGFGATFWNVMNLPTKLAAVVTYYTDPNSYTTRTYYDIGQPGLHDFAPNSQLAIP
ncbi:MAG: hypothetical protein HY074_15525 [Deltaproteobacteria bacterium]|nr:hypothetical protein [Deltaproteobacteria bacterium]